MGFCFEGDTFTGYMCFNSLYPVYITSADMGIIGITSIEAKIFVVTPSSEYIRSRIMLVYNDVHIFVSP